MFSVKYKNYKFLNNLSIFDLLSTCFLSISTRFVLVFGIDWSLDLTYELMVAIDFHNIFFHTMEVDAYCQQFGYQHPSKYLILCSTDKRNSRVWNILRLRHKRGEKSKTNAKSTDPFIAGKTICVHRNSEDPCQCFKMHTHTGWHKCFIIQRAHCSFQSPNVPLFSIYLSILH